MTMLTTPEEIQAFQLASLRSAVKLEIYGMTRRGKSATSIAKKMLGLPRNTPREEVFAILTSLIDAHVCYLGHRDRAIASGI